MPLPNRTERSGAASVETVLDFIRDALRKIQRAVEDGETMSSADIEVSQKHLIDISQNLMRLQNVIPQELFMEISEEIAAIKTKLDTVTASEIDAVIEHRMPRKENNSKKGNSFCDIDKEALLHLLSIGFTVKAIAEKGLLGGKMHPNTLHNFIRRNNIKTRSQSYSEISDEDLTLKLQALSARFPNSGIQEMLAHLSSEIPPIVVQRRRVVALFPKIDPVGTARRWAQTISRRNYSVATPNSMWHIDTCHALISWNFVVDGCIDGYSRLVPYLTISTDNLAKTAFEDFISSVPDYGIPSRIRADKGGEFTHIRKFMEFANGEDRGSFIQGRSVHNIRIERLWRDVSTKVLDKYYKVFKHMEDNHILDVSNDVHLSCLHHVFGSRIKKDLEDWRVAWNNHKIRTEHNQTPRQLWFGGISINSHRDLTSMNNIYRRESDSPVIDMIAEFRENNLLDEPTDIAYVFPRKPLPLTAAERDKLKSDIDIMAESESHGIDVYAQTLHYINECINR